MILHQLVPVVVTFLATISLTCASTRTSEYQQQSSAASKPLPRREHNLDFMDAATMAYYLGVDPSTGKRLDQPPMATEASHNVVVLFYATWDRNSHTVARVWSHFANYLQAGTKKSNIIFGLFDCEYTYEHMNLCKAAGVTAYPAILFMSPNRTFPHRPHVNKSKQPLPHTTQFPGHWQYELSLLDWIRTMQGMGLWARFWDRPKRNNKGWWQRASFDPEMANALPIGIPGGSSPIATASSPSSSSAANLAETNAKLKELEQEKTAYEELVVRSSLLLDATLFPVKDPLTNNSTDLYTYLHATKGWDATDADPRLYVTKLCAMELALDYCTRVTNHQTEDLVKQVETTGASSTLAELETTLKTMIATYEPYCGSLETCIVNDFEADVCRPATCPFVQDVACRYLSSCFDEDIQQEYAKALELTLPAKTAAKATATGTAASSGPSKTTTTEEAASNKPKGGWF